MTKRLADAGHYLKRNGTGYLLMLPYLAVFAVFTVWPVVMSLVLSFTSYNVFEAPRFWGSTTTSICSFATRCF